jgi:hypothetical protein
MTGRERRAVELLNEETLARTTEISDGFFLVPSAHDGAYYVTTKDQCTCPDAQYRNVVCKHQLFIRLRGVLSGSGAAPAPTTIPSRMRAVRED